MRSKSPSSTQLHCGHRTPSGRHCRLPVSDPDFGLCLNHALRKHKDRDLVDLASALTGNSEEFQTAAGINHSLAELYRLLAQNRISPRRAAVLAYISNLLLRTLPAMDLEQDSADGEGRLNIIVDCPRPDRTPETLPS